MQLMYAQSVPSRWSWRRRSNTGAQLSGVRKTKKIKTGRRPRRGFKNKKNKEGNIKINNAAGRTFQFHDAQRDWRSILMLTCWLGLQPGCLQLCDFFFPKREQLNKQRSFLFLGIILLHISFPHMEMRWKYQAGVQRLGVIRLKQTALVAHTLCSVSSKVDKADFIMTSPTQPVGCRQEINKLHARDGAAGQIYRLFSVTDMWPVVSTKTRRSAKNTTR